MPGVNYYNGSDFKEVGAVQQSDGNTAPVFRYDGSQWVKIFPTSTTITDGLLTWWKFNESSGSTANDSATTYADSTAQDGTISGASWTATAKTGGDALDFDGTDDYVDSDTGVIPLNQSFTVTAWVRHSSYNTTDGVGTVLSQWNSNLNFLWRHNESNSVHEFFIRQSDGSNAKAEIADSIISTGSWFHYGWVGDASGGQNIVYLDAAQESSVGWDGTTPTSSGDYLVGSRDDSGNQVADAFIDDMRVYDRALSQSEIQTIYDNTK